MRTESILCRLTREERENVETLQKQLQAASPWAKVSVSDVVRHALAVASTQASAPVSVKARPGAGYILDEDRQEPRKDDDAAE